MPFIDKPTKELVGLFASAVLLACWACGELFCKFNETWFAAGAAEVDDDCDAVLVCWSGVLKFVFSNC